MRCAAALLFGISVAGCGSGQTPPATAQAGKHYEAHCSQPLPVFTLGERSHPTPEQESALCACIWGNLGDWGREISTKIATGKEAEVSKLWESAFTSKFGASVRKCGGMEL
jgi:hypothetical protein